MESVLEQDIPPFVKNSPYLQSLVSNGPFPETGLEVPTGCAKRDLSVNSASDLASLLQTLRFWMVPEVLETCKEFLQYAFDPLNEAALREIGVEYELTMPFVSRVYEVVYEHANETEQMKGAISVGSEGLLRYMCEERGFPQPVDVEFSNVAARAGKVQSLKYLHDNGGEWGISTLSAAADGGCLDCVIYLVVNECADLLKNGFRTILSSAAQSGHLEVVTYLWEVTTPYRDESGSAGVATSAAAGGHLAVFQFVCENRLYLAKHAAMKDLLAMAVREGHLHILQYAYSLGHAADADALACAAQGGHFPCIEFLLHKQCPIGDLDRLGEYLLHTGKFENIIHAERLGIKPWNARTMAAAAEKGLLEGMQYLRERGCPWDERTCASAARGGHLACLQFAHEGGCPWYGTSAGLPEREKIVSASAARAGSLDCLRYVVEHGAALELSTSTQAAIRGLVPVMEYLLSVGCPVDAHTCAVAAWCCDFSSSSPLDWNVAFCPNYDGVLVGDSLGCLRLLRAHGVKWDEHTCIGAIERKNIECLRFAIEHGGPWDTSICTAAAQSGNIECLRVAHELGCPWDAETCYGAARGGHLECLTFAHVRGCPWDEMTCAAAANGRLKCLQYAHEEGCPWDEETCSSAARANSLECLRFAHENGCPWDDFTTMCAASGGLYSDSIACLQYAHEHGCPWTYQAFFEAVEWRNEAAVAYLREHGCPETDPNGNPFPMDEEDFMDL